ncbi:MAG: ABC-ATPase domain-containing protein [Lachnospiraceae bacterium]|nr:ABC-ATPase domain-containing protein [Lachnospiraceae bacterium]MDD7077866.1 ABC-ATPase domain-containing protein [Lachnospiraceae bacterium]MDY3728941.1 ABC-ATPase domain-containing protein [Candidatus Choladocola sp.]
MKTQKELREQLRQIDHKGYKAYKVLEGEYEFGTYRLCIDHVQGDPFATPSRVRILYYNKESVPAEYIGGKYRKTAVEDALLRRLHRNLRICGDKERKGSGKSGLVTACKTGQEILERTAMRVTKEYIEARIEVGFPAFGRTIAAGALADILFDLLPEVVKRTFDPQRSLAKELEDAVFLADDQQYIRNQLKEQGLVAFVADGSVLPRESGVSQKPMKSAVVFQSPASLAVDMDLPHRGKVRGMGIRRGITVVVGGGFHGKSTLLKSLERGVYNHIAGDGRELVITEESAYKLRAEEGRCIHQTDISMFISNLPTKADTTSFSTENASGSTSQAANTMEALASGSSLLLIDEDTSATNFMIRDERMAKLVSDEKEPITPFIRKVRSLYEDLGISTVLVAGSSGDFLAVADTVLQMDCYVAKDVTGRAKELASPLIEEKTKRNLWIKKPVSKKRVEKAKVHGWDTISLDKMEIDLRYMEQIVDESQTAALAYIMQYVLERLADGKKSAVDLAEEVSRKLEKEGILSVTPKNYGAGPASMVRRQEILSCLGRYRLL